MQQPGAAALAWTYGLQPESSGALTARLSFPYTEILALLCLLWGGPHCSRL